MKRALAVRERWMLAAVPALAVLGGYLFVVHHPQQAALGEARRKLADARRDGLLPTHLAAMRQTARELQARLNVLQRGPSSPSTQRGAGDPRRGEPLTDLLGRWKVVVVSTRRLPEADARSAMPPDLGELLRRDGPAAAGTVAGAAAPTVRGVWRIEASGSFAGVRGALDALAGQDLPIVPLGISMEPSEEGLTVHRWSLWIRV